MSHKGELEKWREALGIEERKGPLYEEIQSIDDLFESHRKVLGTEQFEGRECVIIPEFDLVTSPYTHLTQTRKAFLARPVKLRDNNGPFDEKEEPFILAYVEQGDSKYAMRLDVLRGTVTDMGTDSSELLPEDEAKELFGLVKGAASYKLGLMEDAKSAKRRRRFMCGLAVSVVAAAGAGVYVVKEAWDGKKQKQENARQRFDDSNYAINGGNFPVSTGKLAIIASQDFRRIPEYRKGDNFAHPRRVEIEQEDCERFHVSISPEADVRLAIKKNEKYRGEPLAVSRNGNGDLVVCSLNDIGDEGTTNSIGVAIQVRHP